MSLNCDPDELANAARCYCGITGSSAQAVKIYLLAVASGMEGLSADELMVRANQYQCIPAGMIKPVQIYLFCQIATSGQIIQQSCSNLEGTGPPT